MDQALKRFFLVLLLCSPCFGAAAFVHDGFATTGGSVSSVPVTASPNTTAGNALICIAAYSSGLVADFAPCTDTQGNNFQLYSQDAISGAATGISVAFNTVGGADTLTCHSTLLTHSTFFCYYMEVSGVYAVDQCTSGCYKQGSSGLSISYTTPTLASGDFIVGGLWTSGNAGTITNGSGWSHNASVDWEYQVAGAAGSYTTNWTWSSTTTGVSASVALLAGSTPSVGTSVPYKLSPLVQANEGANGTCVFANNVTSGDILLVHSSVASGSTLNTPTDSLSTTYTLVDSNSTQAVTKLWIGTAGSSGANTVTFGGTYSAIGSSCTELNSSLVTSTADFHFSGSFEGEPNILSTPNGTTTVNGDFLFLVTGGNTGSGLTWPVSPLQWLVNSQGQMATDEVLGAAAPTTATFNIQSFVAGNYILVALKPAAAITITTSTCPSGASSSAYVCSLSAIQGVGTYTWSISSGSLPTGLSISSSTGVISGTIGSAATTKTFTVQVTDGTHTTTQSVTITVNGTTNTPSFTQGLLSQLGTSLSFTSVSVGDVLWVTAETHVGLGSGAMGCPTDTLGTNFKFVGGISIPYNSNSTFFNTWLCMGQATSSGADVVSFVSGQYTPAGMQVRNVQTFTDQTAFTTGPTTGSTQTFTSNSLTTPSPNSLSLGAAVVNPSGTASSFAAQSPYTDAGSLLGDGNFVDLGYHVFSSTTSAAFAAAITGSTAGYGWNTVMSNLRATTSGAVVGTTHYFPQMPGVH